MNKVVETILVGDKFIEVSLIPGERWAIEWVRVNSNSPYPACHGNSFDTKDAAIDAAVHDAILVFGG